MINKRCIFVIIVSWNNCNFATELINTFITRFLKGRGSDVMLFL